MLAKSFLSPQTGVCLRHPNALAHVSIFFTWFHPFKCHKSQTSKSGFEMSHAVAWIHKITDLVVFYPPDSDLFLGQWPCSRNWMSEIHAALSCLGLFYDPVSWRWYQTTSAELFLKLQFDPIYSQRYNSIKWFTSPIWSCSETSVSRGGLGPAMAFQTHRTVVFLKAPTPAHLISLGP